MRFTAAATMLACSLLVLLLAVVPGASAAPPAIIKLGAVLPLTGTNKQDSERKKRKRAASKHRCARDEKLTRSRFLLGFHSAVASSPVGSLESCMILCCAVQVLSSARGSVVG
jgi:flagellar biosynthesis component FlhA